jgi:hypothetical protein
VMAAERTGGHFKKISVNNTSIMAYVHGNYEDASERNLLQLIDPYMEQWENLKQQHLLNRLEKAMGAGKLAVGARDVCKEASSQKGRLLVLEKNFRYRAHADKGDRNSGPVYIQDKMDEVIAKVFESGGDVEFVNDGVLSSYKHVAMIKYY